MTGIRILLGLVAFITIALAFDWLLDTLDYPIHPTEQAVFVSFIGAFAGGFIARRRFLLPAVAAWTAASSVVVYFLYRIAEPAGQGSLANILLGNAIALSLSVLALLAGVAVGQILARHRAAARAKVDP